MQENVMNIYKEDCFNDFLISFFSDFKVNIKIFDWNVNMFFWYFHNKFRLFGISSAVRQLNLLDKRKIHIRSIRFFSWWFIDFTQKWFILLLLEENRLTQSVIERWIWRQGERGEMKNRIKICHTKIFLPSIIVHDFIPFSLWGIYKHKSLKVNKWQQNYCQFFLWTSYIFKKNDKSHTPSSSKTLIQSRI